MRCWRGEAEMPTEKWSTPSPRFNEWWDLARPWSPGPANPFEKGSAAFWAWEGWQAALAQPPLLVQEPGGDEWTPCMKLPVVVHVRQQRHGESHVSTREGITPVKPDDLIMRGVSGEEYPIGRAIFEQTYSLDITPPQQKAEPVMTNGLTEAETNKG